MCNRDAGREAGLAEPSGREAGDFADGAALGRALDEGGFDAVLGDAPPTQLINEYS